MSNPKDGADATEVGENPSDNITGIRKALDRIFEQNMQPILDRLERIEQRLDAIEQGK